MFTRCKNSEKKNQNTGDLDIYKVLLLIDLKTVKITK